jgi:hypothetical protein
VADFLLLFAAALVQLCAGSGTPRQVGLPLPERQTQTETKQRRRRAHQHRTPWVARGVHPPVVSQVDRRERTNRRARLDRWSWSMEGPGFGRERKNRRENRISSYAQRFENLNLNHRISRFSGDKPPLSNEKPSFATQNSF